MDQNAPVPNYREVQVETADRPARTTAPAPMSPPMLENRRRHRRTPRWFVWLMGCLLGIVLLALLACALVGGLVMGIALKLANQVTATTTSTQTFTISDTPSLDIHNASGNVQVQQGAPGAVSVHVTKTARDSSQSAAQSDLDKIVVTATQAGNQITLTTNFEDENSFAGSSAVNLLITVPPNTNVAADVTAGDVQVDGVTGVMAISGGAGDTTLQHVVLADGSRIQVATGSVTMQGDVPTNATVDIAVNTGDVALRLAADTTARLDARTNVGDIHITGWGLQPTRVNTVGEFVSGDLGAQPAGTVHIRVDTGDITVSQIGS